MAVNLIIIEIKEMHKLTLKKYLRRIWNYFDLLSLLIPIVACSLQIIVIQSNSKIMNENSFVLRFFSSSAVFFSWIKLLTIARINEKLAFMLRMVIQAF